MKAPRGGRRVLAAIALAALTMLGACGGPAKRASSVPSTTSVPTTATTAVRPRTRHRSPAKQRLHRRHRPRLAHLVSAGPPLCPLTGEPAPGGKVPRRAAIAVKVENLPVARPQWGLDEADIVFEEPVEGGITRFIAVFQCGSASRIEPVRSGRLVDPKILEPMGHILYAYAGAIGPVISEVDAPGSLLGDVGVIKAGSAYWTDPDRYAPHNLETSTAALYRAAAAFHYPEKPPTAIFSYGRPAAGGTPASAVSIDYPISTTTWTWRRDTGTWYRSYSDTGPALQGDGNQISASNVVVMVMHEYQTQYVEDALGAHENGLIFRGSGPAWVFRDGAVFYGRWYRSFLDHPTVFRELNGTKITLTPGNTWEELVPQGIDVSVKP
jgi:hypothetical protein